MNNDSIIIIGIDTHKSFIQHAVLKDVTGASPENHDRSNCNKSPSSNMHDNFKLAMLFTTNSIKKTSNLLSVFYIKAWI